MAGLLPVEDDMSAFGVLFIYFVTMMIMAGTIRIGMGFYDKFSKSCFRVLPDLDSECRAFLRM